MNPQHKAAGRRFESDLVGDSSTAAAGNSLVEAQTIAYRLQQASGYTPGDGDECVQVFIHDLPARTGQGALAWQPRARPKMGAGARSALGVPKSTRVKLLGVPAHFNEAVPPPAYPQDSVAGHVLKVCVRVESANDSKLALLELHEKYRPKCRSIRSRSAQMPCAANEISESIIYIR